MRRRGEGEKKEEDEAAKVLSLPLWSLSALPALVPGGPLRPTLNPPFCLLSLNTFLLWTVEKPSSKPRQHEEAGSTQVSLQGIRKIQRTPELPTWRGARLETLGLPTEYFTPIIRKSILADLGGRSLVVCVLSTHLSLQSQSRECAWAPWTGGRLPEAALPPARGLSR